ncbi:MULTISPECIES: hypothetical protein [unclassified Streptomyces]|uniref:hypothetical protein n=1 Tax=unclassified Streptomyces TaxID=2593676 RepID=UPI0022500D47|nr:MULTISPECIES: hypothetical protein [unclassified Streptomyces]MCX5320977.1 hypothetical protein [Streptomyces sp. NBC_00120]
MRCADEQAAAPAQLEAEARVERATEQRPQGRGHACRHRVQAQRSAPVLAAETSWRMPITWR